MIKPTRQKDRVERIRIVAIYALFGCLWIYLSDTILGWLIRDPGIMTRISVYKGILFIILTSTLLYILIARYMSRVADYNRQLAKSEDRFVSIFNNISDSVFIHDALTGAIVDANESVLRMFGYSREEALRLDLNDISLGESPYSQTEALHWIRQAAVVNIPLTFEWHSKKKDGELFWTECSMRKTSIGGEDFVIVSVRDITERRLIAETLRRSEHFSAIFNRISKTFLTSTHDDEMYDGVLSTILDSMQSPYGLFGYIDEHGSLVCPSLTGDIMAACQMGNKDIIFPESAWGDSIWGNCLRNATGCYSNQSFTVPDGHIRIDRCLAVPLMSQGNKIGLLAVANKAVDYTQEDLRTLQSIADHVAPVLFARLEQQRATRALKESENRLRVIFETTPAGIIMASPRGMITFANRCMAEMFGSDPDQLIGSSYLSHIHPEDHVSGEAEFQRLVSGDVEYCTAERRYCRANGGSFWGYLSSRRHENADGELISIVAIITDMTELKQGEEQRRKLEQQMLHVQKLESLGILAGGIAHDFNNILLAITGNASLALMRLSPESPAVRHLQQIEQAADKAADLARQMLAYSGKGRFVLEPLNLNHIVEEMTNMLQVSISKKAILRYHLTTHLPSIVADATQIRQVVMNLAINASEAIGDTSGVISISTGCMDCDQNYLREVWIDQDLAEGLYVYLEVADTGCGMEREVMDRIFDPFFTTKFTGRGLGMAAILGIVRGHRGAIKVYSEPGRGSNFKILLPASDRPAELYNESPDTTLWQGEGAVLLVDDEETIRAIGSDMLRELGFDVITAADGCEALELFKQQQEHIVFVVLDLTMPHMNGEDAFRELRRINPGVKVIMSSGYNEQEVTQKFTGKGLSGFIQKPYKLSTMIEVIKNII